MIEKKKIRIIGDEYVYYRDVIHHRTITKFAFWDRIKILFGSKVIIDSTIYSKNEDCQIIDSKSVTSVERLIKYEYVKTQCSYQSPF